MDIKGVIVPLITPLTGDEKVDEVGLKRLIDYVIDGGVASIFVLGSSGEAPALQPSEKERLVSLACEHVAGRVPLLVGVIESGTANAVACARSFADLGADGIVATAPYYFSYTQDELAGHFLDILSAVDIPLIVYNIPALTNVDIGLDMMRRLANDTGVIGIKDSAGNLSLFQQFLDLRRGFSNFQVWQGSEPVAAMSVVRGADGVVLGLANIAPRLCVDLYQAASRGNLCRAWELQDQLMQLFVIQRHQSFLSGLKTAAHLLNLCEPTVTKPLCQLNNEQVELVRQVLVDLDLLAAPNTDPN